MSKFKIYFTMPAKSYDDPIEGEYDGVEYDSWEEAQNRIDRDMIYSKGCPFDPDVHFMIQEVTN